MTYQLVTIKGRDDQPVGSGTVPLDLPAVLTALAKAVNVQVGQGWQPLGGVSFAPYGDTFLAAQAITK